MQRSEGRHGDEHHQDRDRDLLAARWHRHGRSLGQSLSSQVGGRRRVSSPHLIEEVRFASDSALEQRRFELSVPP
jgi:hypothetical protein